MQQTVNIELVQHAGVGSWHMWPRVASSVAIKQVSKFKITELSKQNKTYLTSMTVHAFLCIIVKKNLATLSASLVKPPYTNEAFNAARFFLSIVRINGGIKSL